MRRPRQAGNAAIATVIGMAVGLFTTASLLFGVWLVAPFFAPLLLVVLIVSAVTARSAAKRLNLPGLYWPQIVLVALVAWPISIALPYAFLAGEVHLRIDLPPLPADATSVHIRASPLSGNTMYGPAPGIVAEYWTPNSQDAAKSDLVALLPMQVHFQDERLYATSNPNQAQILAKPEGSGTRVKLGVYGDYTSALPWFMFLIGLGWVAIVFLTHPKKS